MLFILDTSILIDIDKGDEDVINFLREIATDHQSAEPAITWVTFFEFYYGALGEAGNAKKALEFLGSFSFLPMDQEATETFTRLKKEKADVKDFDLLISSIAITNRAILITKDGDFKRVKGLSYKIIS